MGYTKHKGEGEGLQRHLAKTGIIETGTVGVFGEKESPGRSVEAKSAVGEA